MWEYRIVCDGPANSTRDPVVADDAHCPGCTVHHREHGPYDETPGRWRVYVTGELAED